MAGKKLSLAKYKKMLVKVKVFANSKKEEIIKKTKDSFVIKVKEKPEMGKANRAVIAALSSYFKTPAFGIRLVKGAKQKNKIFEIR